MQIFFGYLQILKSLMVTSSIKGRSLLASKKYTIALSGHSSFFCTIFYVRSITNGEIIFFYGRGKVFPQKRKDLSRVHQALDMNLEYTHTVSDTMGLILLPGKNRPHQPNKKTKCQMFIKSCKNNNNNGTSSTNSTNDKHYERDNNNNKHIWLSLATSEKRRFFRRLVKIFRTRLSQFNFDWDLEFPQMTKNEEKCSCEHVSFYRIVTLKCGNVQYFLLVFGYPALASCRTVSPFLLC